MTMLSRVAERTYWLGRYLERVESLARLYQVYGRVFLDLPPSAGVGWREILEVTGTSEAYARRGGTYDDEAVAGYLLSAPENPGSLLASLALARENARTTRDILPTEAWLVLNRLYVNLRERIPHVRTESARHAALTDVVSACQTLTGVLLDNMSHGAAYQFARAGRNLERIDMSSRMLDAAVALLMSGRAELEPMNNTLWAAVLRSVSGYQMYRQYVRRRVVGDEVVRFLIRNEEFPRAMSFCVRELEATLVGLPRGNGMDKALAPVRRQLASLNPEALDAPGLHALIDRLQIDIGSAHDAIAARWFAHGNYS